MVSKTPVLNHTSKSEFVLAEIQDEYENLTVVALDDGVFGTHNLVSRWKISDEERQQIADGADICLQQLTFGNPFQPVNLQVVMPDQDPAICKL